MVQIQPGAMVRAALLLCVLVFATVLPARAADPLRVVLNWSPTSVLAAFYVAEDKGLYADAGVRVLLQHQGQAVQPLEALGLGPRDLVVASPAELIAARAHGLKLKAIMALSQRSPVVFISKADYGITRPAQILGETVRTTPEMTPILNAMLVGEGLSTDCWTPVTLPSSPQAFHTGPARVWGVYANGLAQQLTNAGEAINVIYPEDYGLGLYGNVIAAPEALIAGEPVLLRAFVAATLSGLSMSLEQPDLAVAGTLTRDPGARAATERERFLGAIPLFRGRARVPGAMDDATWANALAVARQAGVATGAMRPADLYMVDLLP